MEKRYCKACGTELIFKDELYMGGFDTHTGKRSTLHWYSWKCPNNAGLLNFLAGHTVVEYNGGTDGWAKPDYETGLHCNDSDMWTD